MALVPHVRLGSDVVVDLDVVAGIITGISAKNTRARDVVVTVRIAGLTQTVTVPAGTINATRIALGTGVGDVASLQIGVRQV